MDENLQDDCLRRVGSLPPRVLGKINGYLSLTIDKIKWWIVPCDVDVYILWWGEKPQELFVPQVSQICGSLETTYIYRIMTNTELFVSYLQDCEELNFELYEQSTRNHLGTTTLNNLLSIILNNPFKSTNVVTDKDGTKIADITISFVFVNNILMPRELGNFETMIHNILEKIQNIDMRDKRRDSVGEKTCINDILFADIHQSRPEILNVKAKEKNIFTLNNNDDIVSNSSISELLEQSHSIRQEYYNYGKLDFIPCELKTGKEYTTTEHKIKDYLCGKDLSKEEECVALEAVKFRSEQELLELAEDCSSEFEKNVQTGQLIYSKGNRGKQKVWSLMCSSRRHTKDSNKFGKQIKDSQNENKKNRVILDHKSGSLYYSREKDSSVSCFRYLQLTVQTLSLNYVGMQRVHVSSQALTSNTQSRNSAHCCQLPPNVVYFVEYEIPQILRFRSSESQNANKPWNSNLNRICSRQRTGKCIHFHRQMIHMLASYKPKFREFLSTSSITFKVYSRHLNQRLPCLIGEASLSLEKVVKSCANGVQELQILPQSNRNSNQMLSLGNLKVKIEFGSNRTSFNMKEVYSVVAQSLSSSESEYENEDLDTQSTKIISKCSKIISKSQKGKLGHSKNNSKDVIAGKNISAENFKKGKLEPVPKISKIINDRNENILLLGLLHVSLGRNIKASGSYLISHGFWKEDLMTSDIHRQTENPIFKFHKIMPVLLTLELLDRCYNNYMVIEVWSESSLIGIAKLPLNQFYIAYRDPPVVEQLLSSKYPIISTDGWVDVVDPVTQYQVGQLSVILALGTENQIQMLEMSRCLKEDIHSQATLKSFSDCVISLSKQPPNDFTENEQILKLRNRGSAQNEIDLHYDEDISDNQSAHFLENTNVLGDESLRIDPNVTPVRSECNPDVSAIISVNPEIDLSSVQFDPKQFIVHDENVLQRSNDSVDKHIVSRCHEKYLEKIDTEANLKLNSPRSSDQKLSFVLNTTHNTFEESEELLVREEYHYPFKADDVFSGGVVNIESSSNGAARSFLPYNSYDSNNEEHTIGVHKSLHIDSNISENRRKCCKNSNDFFRNWGIQEKLPCYSNLTLEDLDYNAKIIHDSEYQESRDQNDKEFIKSNDNSSIIALTENASTQTDILCTENFFAMVEIINGLYISKLDDGELPNCYVTFHIANNLIMTTSVVNENIDPVWNWSSEVWLPVSLLENDGSCLIFKICHKNNRSEHSISLQDLIIGFVGIDLSVLVCGLPSISGWFNINDLSGNCKGQIQVTITPFENMSQIQNIIQAKYKINEKKCQENDSVSEIKMPHVIPDDLEKCNTTILHDKTQSEVNKANFISQSGKEIVNSSLQNHERDPCSNNKGKYFLYESVPQLCNASKKSSINLDSSSLKFYKSPFHFMNQTCFENHSGNHYSESQTNCALLDSNSSLKTSSNINCPTNARCNCNVNHVSILTKTLSQKFKELDEIIHQMEIKSKHRNTELKTKSSENILNSKSKTNKEPCGELVCCANKCSSVNVSNGILEPNKSEEITHGHTEKHVSNASPFSCTKKLFEEEMNTSEVSEAGTKLEQQSQDAGRLAMGSPVCIESNPKSSDVLEIENAESVTLPDLTTDHLMCEALHEMDLESIFNPLLFQHIIANYQSQNRLSEWCYENKRNSYSFHETNNSVSLQSKRKKSSLQNSHNHTKLLADNSSKSNFCECSKIEGPGSLNCVDTKKFILCDSSPRISDEITEDSRGDLIDNESFYSARPSSTCDYSSPSENLKLQNSYSYRNTPKTSRNSTQRNFNENFKSSEMVLLNDTEHLYQSDSCLIDKTSIFKRQYVDQKILNATQNDESENMEPCANCNYESEIKGSLVEPEKNVVTSLNKIVMSEKSMLEDYESERLVTKCDSSSNSENLDKQNKV